ncbi:MAG TPA: hypothetical protein VJ978_09715, partial [Nitriliruptoraceae bacterium]|nr:hypothetical protein [Nitriliruptoraceae bacterium]
MAQAHERRARPPSCTAGHDPEAAPTGPGVGPRPRGTRVAEGGAPMTTYRERLIEEGRDFQEVVYYSLDAKGRF